MLIGKGWRGACAGKEGTRLGNGGKSGKGKEDRYAGKPGGVEADEGGSNGAEATERVWVLRDGSERKKFAKKRVRFTE